MKTFSTSISSEIAKETAAGWWLCKISMSSTYTYTDCDIDLNYGGDTYQARGLEVKGIEQSQGFSPDGLQVSFDNVDRTMSAIVLGEDAANQPVSLYYTMLIRTTNAGADIRTIVGDSTRVTISGDIRILAGGSTSLEGTTSISFVTEELFNGFISEWDLDESKLELKVSNEFKFWHKKTLRLPTPNCPYNFKGDECGYADSETWCDKSPERCAALSNYDNFGGRKFIADIENKEIYWGPKGYK